jgi:deazaflavin-dependent oxidoreductase (nitroreductase family)
MAAPGPVAKRLLRAPIVLYGIGAGALLGRRFLLLTHRGRRSGRRYRTILEVVAWDAAAEEATVVSGFGPRASWYLNVLAGGAEEIRIARDRFRPEVRRVQGDEAVRVVAEYERRARFAKPLVRAVLSRLAGHPYDGSEEARRELVDELPLVAFRRPADQPGEAG